jgi:hypothetical protein
MSPLGAIRAASGAVASIRTIPTMAYGTKKHCSSFVSCQPQKKQLFVVLSRKKTKYTLILLFSLQLLTIGRPV